MMEAVLPINKLTEAYTIHEFMVACGIEISDKISSLTKNISAIVSDLLKTNINGTIDFARKTQGLVNRKIITEDDQITLLKKYEENIQPIQEFNSNDDSFLGSEAGIYNEDGYLSSFPGQKKQLTLKETTLLEEKIEKGYKQNKPSIAPWV